MNQYEYRRIGYSARAIAAQEQEAADRYRALLTALLPAAAILLAAAIVMGRLLAA